MPRAWTATRELGPACCPQPLSSRCRDLDSAGPGALASVSPAVKWAVGWGDGAPSAQRLRGLPRGQARRRLWVQLPRLP